MTHDEIMQALTEMEAQLMATEFVRLLKRYQAVLWPTFIEYGWRMTPKSDEQWLTNFQKARDKWWARRYLPPEETDEVILAELPGGAGFIGRRSQYNAVVSEMKRGRTLQTLENIRGSALGTFGWFVYGDAGSDVGAGLGRGLGAVGGAGTLRSQYKALSQVPVQHTTSGYIAPIRRGTTGDRAIANTGTVNRVTAPPKLPAPPPPTVRPVAVPPASAPKPPVNVPRQTSATATPGKPVTSAAAAAGVPRPLIAKFRSLKINTEDAYTMYKITKISDVNKTPDEYLQRARTGSGELRVLVREGRDPGVQSLRFIKEGKQRTPDFEVTMKDGSRRFVEVRTIPDAGQKTLVKHASQVRTPLPDTFEQLIEAKIRHGQISETYPGKIVFHAPFRPVDSRSLEGWRDMLKAMLARGPFPKGLNRIEVTSGKTQSILIFQPPDWKGVIVK